MKKTSSDVSRMILHIYVFCYEGLHKYVDKLKRLVMKIKSVSVYTVVTIQ